MRQEEIEIYKDLKTSLSNAIDRLKALNAVEPREFWLYYNEHGEQWRSIDPDEAMALSDDIEVIHVKEVIDG